MRSGVHSPKRLLIPVLGFSASGGNRVLSRFATELQRTGEWDVTFLAPECTQAPYYPTEAHILYCDPLGRPGGSPGQPKRMKGQILVTLLLGLWRLHEGYDRILLNDSLSVLPAWLAGLRHRSLYYIQAYEPDFYRDLPGLKNRLSGLLSRWSYNLVPSQVVNAPLYLDYGPIQARHVLYPGIDLQVFHPKAPETFWFAEGRPIILGTVGRKEPIKGTPQALAGIKAFLEQGIPCRIRVALGHVPEAFRDLPGLEVVPIHSDEELAAFYRSLDVLIVAGTAQFGAVHYPTMEGLASGIAVVTTPYVPATHDNAWLLPHPCAHAIKQNLNEIYQANHNILQKINPRSIHQFDWHHLTLTVFLEFLNS